MNISTCFVATDYSTYPAIEKSNLDRYFVPDESLIAISTVFVKQHSILDLLAALPLCAIAYVVCFRIRKTNG